ncbi:MAG: DUF1367 family protein [Candidatus Saccharibacteria bacterium]|nr:DUF1367 family protein [Rhodoferax sp.]
MQEMVLIKGPNNSLHPATEEDAQKLSKFKIGRGVRLKATQMSEHNTKFHRKLLALFQLGFDRFSEQLDTGMEYKGRLIKASFNTFRKQLTIQAGHYDPVFNLDGTFELEACSLSYAKATDEQKAQIYSDVIQASLDHVFEAGMAEDELRGLVDKFLAFDN